MRTQPSTLNLLLIAIPLLLIGGGLLLRVMTPTRFSFEDDFSMVTRAL